MARYKHIDTSPRLLPVDLARQLLPGTFEHALNFEWVCISATTRRISVILTSIAASVL